MMQFRLTEASIRNRVGEQSFKRGKRYFQQDAIMSPWMQGSVLKAKCWGSMPQPYHVWVQLGANGIDSGECSCPVGDGGYCKHVAALLLMWLHKPDSFQEIEPLDKALKRQEKDDLIVLIRQMITRYPDLEELIFLSTPGGASANAPINPDLIRRQVQNAVKHGDYGHDYYGAAQTIANELQAIMQQGDVYRELGDWLNTAVIYRTVLDELRNQYNQIYDHDGDLGAVFGDGSERLGMCLQAIEQPEPRLDILRTLVNIVFDDINIGGYGFGDEAYGIVLDQATAVEKIETVSWVEEELRKFSDLDDFSSKWRTEAYGRFLINLQMQSLSDEEYIALCRRTGQFQALIERLLQLGRVQEAIADSQAASDYELLTLADLFVTHGHGKVAEEIIWERTGTSKDTRLDGWLKKRAVESGDWQKAMKYAENQYWARPTVEGYGELKAMAEQLDNWPDSRKEILTRLTQKEEYELLTRIYLLENDVETALETLPKVRFGGNLAIEVARAAEETHPRQSLNIYQQKVERLITARGRDNYAQAAEYLKRVQALFIQLKETENWQDYIQGIRNQKPRLPALPDELKRVGL